MTTAGGTSSPLTFTYTSNTPSGPQYCPMIPLWVNDLLYGNPGGGFYWDPVSGLVWTPARGWHLFAPDPFRFVWLPLWADAITYGSIGQGFWWDPTSGLVWTMERSWHMYSPQGCIAR